MREPVQPIDVLGLYIDGRHVNGSGPALPAINPYTGKPFAEVLCADRSDVDAAVVAAARVFETWRRTSGLERAELIHALATALLRDADRLGAIETCDNGKIFRETSNQPEEPSSGTRGPIARAPRDGDHRRGARRRRRHRRPSRDHRRDRHRRPDDPR